MSSQKKCNFNPLPYKKELHTVNYPFRRAYGNLNLPSFTGSAENIKDKKSGLPQDREEREKNQAIAFSCLFLYSRPLRLCGSPLLFPRSIPYDVGFTSLRSS
jgi:hypothetical protein